MVTVLIRVPSDGRPTPPTRALPHRFIPVPEYQYKSAAFVAAAATVLPSPRVVCTGSLVLKHFFAAVNNLRVRVRCERAGHAMCRNKETSWR